MAPDQLIRLECLKLAVTVPGAERGARSVVDQATDYATFVRGSDKDAGEEASLRRSEGASLASPVPAQPSKPQDKAPLRHDRR